MRLDTHSLSDGDAAFSVDLYAAPHPTHALLFAAGRGGSPARHRGFLTQLAQAGLTVIAPHFDMMASPMAGADDLHIRLRRLERARHAFAPSGVPLVGAGHSIGASLLLVMAGATAWTFSRQPVSATAKTPFHRLMLFAPPTQLFMPPGALDAVDVPVTVWAGQRDDITPPDQALFLGDAVDAEVRIFADAGHFTFMDEVPPHVSDPHPDRAGFLSGLADEVIEKIGA